MTRLINFNFHCGVEEMELVEGRERERAPEVERKAKTYWHYFTENRSVHTTAPIDEATTHLDNVQDGIAHLLHRLRGGKVAGVATLSDLCLGIIHVLSFVSYGD